MKQVFKDFDKVDFGKKFNCKKSQNKAIKWFQNNIRTISNEILNKEHR
jgi:hypothetical protein